MRKDVEFENSGEIRDFEEYSENKLAVAKVCVLSTAPNSHQLNISEEVLRRDIGSIRGNFLVAHMLAGDATTHTSSEVPVGYFLPDEPIEFEEVEQDGRKVVKAWAYAVLSKQYAKSAYDMFVNDNHRATSIEMAVTVSEEDENEVVSFDAYGSTILGKNVAPSCKDAEISLVRFAEEANNFYGEHKDKLSVLKQFAKEREQMAEKDNYVNHPIDTSKEALYEGEWDGQKAKQDLVKEKNFKLLAPKVCMKLEEGWENREVTKLGYPVMMLYDGKWVYSRQGLASALGYAKKENETTVVNKIEKIYKKLDLDDNEGGKEEKMAEIEFSAVNISNLWSRIYDVIHEHDDWDYCIQGIYEEDNRKFAILIGRDQKLYRLDFSLTEEGMTVSDELVEVKQEFTEIDNIKKFAEPENAERYTKFTDPKKDEGKGEDGGKKPDEGEPTKMSEDEMMAKITELEKSVEERDHIIMDKDTELEELRAYKAGVVAKENMAKVDSIMEEVKPYVSEEKFAEFKAEGLACDAETIDAWSNKIKAACFSEVKKNIKKDDKGVFTFAMPCPTPKSKSNSIWDRLENK